MRVVREFTFWEDYSGIGKSKKCLCRERVYFVSPKALWRGKKWHIEEEIRVGLRSMLIIISAPHLQSAVLVFPLYTTNHSTSHTKVFCLAMLDFHFLNFNSPSHMEACVQINWCVFFALVFRSAWCKYATAWGFVWKAGGQHTFAVVLQQFTRQGTVRFAGTEACN